VAEDLALEQGVRQRRAVDGDEGSVAPAAAAVNASREQFLARAALAEEQHGGVRDGDLVHLRHDRQHRRVLRDELVGRVRGALRTLAVLGQALPFQRAPHDDPQLVRAAERLHQVVEGAELHRLDGGRDGRVARQDDHLRFPATRRGPSSRRSSRRRAACADR